MPRFQKGKPRPAKSGRRPGSKNRITLAVREAVLEALNTGEGAVSFFLKLKNGSAESKRTFAHICARLIPHEVSVGVAPIVPIDPSDMHEIARRAAFVLQTAAQVQSATVIELPRPKKVGNAAD